MVLVRLVFFLKRLAFVFRATVWLMLAFLIFTVLGSNFVLFLILFIFWWERFFLPPYRLGIVKFLAPGFRDCPFLLVARSRAP